MITVVIGNRGSPFRIDGKEMHFGSDCFYIIEGIHKAEGVRQTLYFRTSSEAKMEESSKSDLAIGLGVISFIAGISGNKKTSKGISGLINLL